MNLAQTDSDWSLVTLAQRVQSKIVKRGQAEVLAENPPVTSEQQRTTPKNSHSPQTSHNHSAANLNKEQSSSLIHDELNTTERTEDMSNNQVVDTSQLSKRPPVISSSPQLNHGERNPALQIQSNVWDKKEEDHLNGESSKIQDQVQENNGGVVENKE